MSLVDTDVLLLSIVEFDVESTASEAWCCKIKTAQTDKRAVAIILNCFDFVVLKPCLMLIDFANEASRNGVVLNLIDELEMEEELPSCGTESLTILVIRPYFNLCRVLISKSIYYMYIEGNIEKKIRIIILLEQKQKSLIK